MITLTEQQIADAKANDLTAVAAVVAATEKTVTDLARHYATTGGRTNADLAEDLAQVGRIAVWESISRFRGSSLPEFVAFVIRTVKGAMSDARKEETRHGVSRQAAADFERALSLADGDAHEAEYLVTTTEVMGARKMSPELAYAARLSYQGVKYLDAPLSATGSGFGGDGADRRTVGEWLAERLAVPAELLEPADYERDRRDQTRERVHHTLGLMGEQQRYVLMALTGIEPVQCYGTENDTELAAEMGLPRHRMSVLRSKGKDRFAMLWTQAA